MEVGEGSSDIASKDDIATPTPLDPLKGLPQFFRQRGFSSDFSEDGDVVGSRRNSTSEGGVAMTPVQPAVPSVTGLKITEGRVPSQEPPPQDATFEDISKSDDRTAFQAPSSADNASRLLMSAPPPRSLPVKSAQLTPMPPPLQSPIAPQRGRGAPKLPPPLRLISPTAMEPVKPAFHAQPPSLSPLCRSPGGRRIRFGMPILSPLHTPLVRLALPPPQVRKQEFAEPSPSTPLSPNNARHNIPATSLPGDRPVQAAALDWVHQDVFKTPEAPSAIEQGSPTALSPQPISSPPNLTLKSFSVNIRRSPSVSSISSKSPTPTPPPDNVASSPQTEKQEPVLDSSLRPPSRLSVGHKTVSDDEKASSVSPAPLSPTETREEGAMQRESSLSVSSSSLSTPSPTTPTLFGLRATRGGKTLSISPAPRADTAERPEEEERKNLEHSPISSDDEYNEDQQDLSSPFSEHVTTPPTLIRESTPVDNVITEEVATLDSGVGGVVGGVVEESGTLLGEIMQDDDIVQTIDSRGSPVSDDDVIVQSSARNQSATSAISHTHRGTVEQRGVSQDALDKTFSSDEESGDSDAESADSDDVKQVAVSVPTRRVPLGSGFVSKETGSRGAVVKGGVAGQDSQPKRGLVTDEV